MELIRPVALFLLLFCGVAVGAEAERRQAEPCANGNTHQAGFCPAVLSSASCSATGATTGSCSATSDETDGTRHVCATSSVTALTGAQIEACSGGAAISGSSASETGSNSVSLSGLTTDAAHYGQIVNESPEGWYSNRLVSNSFTPTDSSDPYDLYATDSQSRGTIPFAVNWPTEPTITNTETASDLSTLNSHITTAGTKVTVSGTVTGSLSNPANDVWIELAAGAVIGNYGSVWDFGFGGVQRLKITCADPRNCQFRGGITFPTDTTDVLIDGVTFSETSTSGTARHNIWDTSRLAIINSTVTGNNYTLLANSGTNSDIILANSHFVARSVPSGGNGAIRLKDITRLIIVDVFADTETNDTGFEPFRLEDGVNDVWVRNLTADGGGWRIADMGGGEPTDIWIYDSTSNWDGALGLNHLDGVASDVTNLTIEDVTFGGSGVTPGNNVISSPQPSWSITNFVFGSESTPSWSFQ